MGNRVQVDERGFATGGGNNGLIWGWGTNWEGNLGDGTTTVTNTTAVQASNLNSAEMVVAGGNHSLALRSDGTVWAWGYNYYGQVGDGTTIERTTPVQVASLTETVAIASGHDHSLAIRSDGTVWAWGRNDLGELGDGTTTNRSNPVQVAGLSGIVAIAGGGGHSLALKSDGTVWAWGVNSAGQLGDGTNTDSSSAVQVSGLTGVAAISAGLVHSLAVKSDGTVWAWGGNESAQLGDGTTTNRNSPVQVANLSGVAAVAGGGDHSLALKNDGTVWAWGRNDDGQLGDGTHTQRSTPVQVDGLSGVSAIDAGQYFSLALKADGTVWAWGYNYLGQLGDGTILDRDTPVQATGLDRKVTAISAGWAHALAVRTHTVTSLGYDTLSRLTSATNIDGALAYAYDPVGNRTVYTNTYGTVTSYTYDAADRLLTAGDSSYTWDNNGNLLTEGNGVVTSTYTYDYANRLKTASIVDFYSTYAYNGDGLLLRKTTDGFSTYFTYDVNAALPVVITDSNSLYLYGLSLIAQQQGANVSYYHQDALGSVRNLTDGSGSLTMSYGYDPFGQSTYTSGTANNPFRYTGQYLDNQTGLYYLRARYYQPATGRFTSPDTLAPDRNYPQSLNRYAYAYNNPLRFTDPSGHKATVGQTFDVTSSCGGDGGLDDGELNRCLFSPICAYEKFALWNDPEGLEAYLLGYWFNNHLGYEPWNDPFLDAADPYGTQRSWISFAFDKWAWRNPDKVAEALGLRAELEGSGYVTAEDLVVFVPAIIIGAPHSSPEHQAETLRQAEIVDKMPGIETTLINRSLKTAGLNGSQRPDVIGIGKKVAAVIREVRSRSQMSGKGATDLEEKMARMLRQNPDAAGEIVKPR